MLYLLESSGFYKIGHSSNVESRMKSYKTHNPDFTLLDSLPGDENDESLLHKRLKEFQYYTEWFYKNPKVLEIWNHYKAIYKEKILPGRKKIEEMTKSLYEELLEEFNRI